ncbi:phage portal protein [Brachybacterium muris]|uniref:phage portal protein n=1 Tax=Brachybacterium muris TaxID=219301 RepID=UPI00223A94A2|nr:phage portal protein [Brachybacterium muris]
MALDLEVTRSLDRLNVLRDARWPDDERLDKYYNGTQRLKLMGLAVPPALRSFETVVNWPRLTVDALEARLDVKTFYLPDGTRADAVLEGWAYNNLDSESSLAHLDALIYGRAFVCVGANEDDPAHPLVTVESPREITVEIDPRTRRIARALRVYGVSEKTGLPMHATLYEPDATTWFQRDEAFGRWAETGRDEHRLGRVPIVMMVNRRRAGDFSGVSEMADVIGLTDSAAQALTNLRLAAETHAIPARHVAGVSKGDFVDSAGNVLPVWESYFTAIMATANKDAKFGQFSASDLKNFHETVNHYAGLVASVTKMPTTYLGLTTSNPASADAIRSAEAPHVKLAERKQRAFGDSWAWVAALYERFRTGEWTSGDAFRTHWHDAATPTVQARADSIVKLTGGKPVLSIEGAWDEMGWSEARKQTERERLASEAEDPELTRIMRDLVVGTEATNVVADDPGSVS